MITLDRNSLKKRKKSKSLRKKSSSDSWSENDFVSVAKEIIDKIERFHE